MEALGRIELWMNEPCPTSRFSPFKHANSFEIFLCVERMRRSSTFVTQVASFSIVTIKLWLPWEIILPEAPAPMIATDLTSGDPDISETKMKAVKSYYKLVLSNVFKEKQIHLGMISYKLAGCFIFSVRKAGWLRAILRIWNKALEHQLLLASTKVWNPNNHKIVDIDNRIKMDWSIAAWIGTCAIKD